MYAENVPVTLESIKFILPKEAMLQPIRFAPEVQPCLADSLFNYLICKHHPLTIMHLATFKKFEITNEYHSQSCIETLHERRSGNEV